MYKLFTKLLCSINSFCGYRFQNAMLEEHFLETGIFNNILSPACLPATSLFSGRGNVFCNRRSPKCAADPQGIPPLQAYSLRLKTHRAPSLQTKSAAPDGAALFIRLCCGSSAEDTYSSSRFLRVKYTPAADRALMAAMTVRGSPVAGTSARGTSSSSMKKSS